MTTHVDLGMPPVGGSVLLADPRGYCAGVDRAVITVEKALDLYGAPVYVRKQIVHNKHVVNTLAERGAVFVEELDEVPEGATVVFSAHGVSPMVHEQAAERGLKTIDATCPLVTKVHHEARRFAAEDYRIDDVSELQEEWLDGVETVGVTSGASVPDDLVQDVLTYLAEHGHPDAAAVRTADETLTFALPPELRRDMKAAGKV